MSVFRLFRCFRPLRVLLKKTVGPFFAGLGAAMAFWPVQPKPLL